MHQQLFDEDAEVARSLANKVATVNWNTVFTEGFGRMTMHGIPQCVGPWVLWLGTGETVAEQLIPIRQFLGSCKNRKLVFRCNHHGDLNLWQRIFCPEAGNFIGGLIHEDVAGEQSHILFRMQDTPKEPHEDPFHNEVLKWTKTCAYNANYFRLGKNPHELSNTHEGWKGFVAGAWESIENFCREHDDLISAAMSGDRPAFYDGVRRRMDADKPAVGVNFAPQGEPRTGNETIP